MGKFNRICTAIGASCALFLLSGCVAQPQQVGGDRASNPKAFQTVTVSGQNVVVGGAAGYCLNNQRSRNTADGAFLVLAPCAGDASDTTPMGLVLINVSASEALQEALKTDEMDEFFRSTEGRTALSANGKSADVEILGTMENDASYVVHSRDAAGPIIPDTSEDQWRMFFIVAERLVSISVINFTDAPMPDGEIFRQMEEIANRIRSLNI